MLNELVQLAKKHQIEERVWFYGACYEDETLAPLIFNASITISPGNVGLTAIHSLSFGTPIITHNNFATQMPEFESIIEGRTGSFFEENNVNDLTEKIKAWLPVLDKNRETIRANCFQIVDRYYNTNYQINLLKKILK